MIEIIGNIGDVTILAASLPETVTSVIKIFRLIALMLAIIGIVYSGIKFSQGDLSAAGYGIIGAGIVGIAGVIAVELFEASGSDIPIIDY